LCESAYMWNMKGKPKAMSGPVRIQEQNSPPAPADQWS
jgi:hypothetical protein